MQSKHYSKLVAVLGVFTCLFLLGIHPAEAQSGVLSGYVLDVSSDPIQSVDVNLMRSGNPDEAGENAWDWVDMATSNASGYYEFSGLSSRYYHMSIWGGQEKGSNHYINQDLYNIQVTDGNTTANQDFSLKTAGRIYGYVKRDSDNSVIPYASVMTNLAYTETGYYWYNDYTDSTGMYELWVLPTTNDFYPVKLAEALDPGTTYEVYGGTSLLCNQGGLSPAENGYTLVGTGTGTATTTFTNGSNYQYYIIKADSGNLALVDAVQDSGGSYLTNIECGNDIENWNYIDGSPADGSGVSVNARPLVQHDDGGYITLDTGSGSNSSLVVHIADDGLSRPDTPSFYEAMVNSNFYSASTVGNGVRGPDFVVKEGGNITGTVMNSSGQGIPNVWVAPDVWKNGHIREPGTNTASDGTYTLGSMPVSDKIFVMTGGDSISYQGVKYGVSGMLGPLTVTAGGTTAAPNITVKNAGMMIGQVVDEDGNAIEGAEFEAEGFDADGNKSWGGGGAYSDSSGDYELDYLPPGVYRVTAEKDGYAAASMHDVIIIAGQTTTNSNMVLPGSAYTAHITGSVTNYTDIAPKYNGVLLPYPEANDYNSYGFPWVEIIALKHNVNMSDEEYLDLFPIGFAHMDDGYDDYFVASSTETAGNYELTLPTGNIDVALAKGGFSEGGWYVTLNDWHSMLLTKGTTLSNQNFTAPTNNGQLYGAINVPDGYNLSSRTIVLVFNENDSSQGMPEGLAQTEFKRPYYQFPALAAGTYTIRAISDGLSTKVYEGVTVSSGGTTNWPINFAAGGTLSGTVTDEVSDPIEGARIKIVETGKACITDSSGAYSIPGLATGTYNLEVDGIGFTHTTGTASVTVGQTTTKDFQLSSQIGSISGSVTYNANPVNNVVVVAYHTTNETHISVKTVGGAYTIPELAYGSYNVSFHAEGYGSGEYASNPVVISGGTPNPTGVSIVVVEESPEFFMTSTVSGSTLSLSFFCGVPLDNVADSPGITVTAGLGTLGAVTTLTNQRWDVDYTVDANDATVTVQIVGERNSTVGNNSFSFDFSEDFKETATQDMNNSSGVTLSLSSSEENTGIEIPPYTLTGAGNTTDVTMSIDCFGEPGDVVKDTSETSLSSVYDFSFSDSNVEIDGTKSITITMSFELPDDMTHEEFEAQLEMKYYDTVTQTWKTDGISNVRVNWVNYTIKFDVNHLTEFAAFQKSSSSSSSSSDSDSSGGCSIAADPHHFSMSTAVANMLVLFIPLILFKIMRYRLVLARVKKQR